MAKDFRTLEAKMSPAARARGAAQAQTFIETMALDELREARRLTQNHLAGLLGVKQAAISKLERRTDMYVSSLKHTIEAMGGELEIRAKFPDGHCVRVGQFGDGAPLAKGRRRAAAG
jgi:DNA-binding XRE family transcriptional regulator